MEWSIAESTRYSVKLSDSEGTLNLAGLTADGQEKTHGEISIARDAQANRLLVEIDGSAHIAHVAKVGDDWWIHLDGRIHMVTGHEPGSSSDSSGEGGLTAPMPGTILEVHVKEGQRVREGQTLLVMEAMKMESGVKAPVAGTVAEIHVSAGDTVQAGAPLLTLNS